MLIEPKVGQRVVCISEDCCDGFVEGTPGEIVKIEDDNHILVMPDGGVTDNDAIWHCILCLDPE
jgi:hypothetical protein